MAHVSYCIIVKKGVSEVWDTLMDFEHVSNWQPNVLKSFVSPEGTCKIGSVITTVGEIVEYEKDKKIVTKSTKENSPPPFHTEYIVEEISDGTKITFTIDLYTSRFLKIIDPLMQIGVKKDVIIRYNNLKSYLEK
jgi:hypothetical protein